MTSEQDAAQWRHANESQARWWEARAKAIEAGTARLTVSQKPDAERRKAVRRAAEYRAKLEVTECESR